PWDADSLEWSTTSPPPDWNYEAIPYVTSRHPLWEEEPLLTCASGGDEATQSLGPEGTLARETPLTTGLESAPSDTMRIPQPSSSPGLLASGIAILFVALLVKAELVAAVGGVIGVSAVVRWAWHTGETSPVEASEL